MWLKAVVFIWPFLKELLLGERTLKEAVRSNKVRLITIGVILLSVALNFFLLPRLVTITRDHLELMKKYKEVTKELEALKTKSPVILAKPADAKPAVVLEAVTVTTPPASRGTKPAHKPTLGKPPKVPTAQSKEDEEEQRRLRQVRERLEQLEQLENQQRLKDAARIDGYRTGTPK